MGLLLQLLVNSQVCKVLDICGHLGQRLLVIFEHIYLVRTCLTIFTKGHSYLSLILFFDFRIDSPLPCRLVQLPFGHLKQTMPFIVRVNIALSGRRVQTYGEKVSSLAESHLPGLYHFYGMFERFLLRHFRSVDGDSLELEAPGPAGRLAPVVKRVAQSGVVDAVNVLVAGSHGRCQMRKDRMNLVTTDSMQHKVQTEVREDFKMPKKNKNIIFELFAFEKKSPRRKVQTLEIW